MMLLCMEQVADGAKRSNNVCKKTNGSLGNSPGAANAIDRGH